MLLFPGARRLDGNRPWRVSLTRAHSRRQKVDQIYRSYATYLRTKYPNTSDMQHPSTLVILLWDVGRVSFRQRQRGLVGDFH